MTNVVVWRPVPSLPPAEISIILTVPTLSPRASLCLLLLTIIIICEFFCFMQRLIDWSRCRNREDNKVNGGEGGLDLLTGLGEPFSETGACIGVGYTVFGIL